MVAEVGWRRHLRSHKLFVDWGVVPLHKLGFFSTCLISAIIAATSCCGTAAMFSEGNVTPYCRLERPARRVVPHDTTPIDIAIVPECTYSPCFHIVATLSPYSHHATRHCRCLHTDWQDGALP
ncbi:hypothetical protein PR048_030913 [Dryococelus australis]|uniref:Uncharacterized protein n=1 Tax=Dryococelus australis TaxID=614101 RepID=A0ABQ9GD19_9NEOP|nr:hypothetical protein PR048_030913 [Dryococelus australis]